MCYLLAEKRISRTFRDVWPKAQRKAGTLGLFLWEGLVLLCVRHTPGLCLPPGLPSCMRLLVVPGSDEARMCLLLFSEVWSSQDSVWRLITSTRHPDEAVCSSKGGL